MSINPALLLILGALPAALLRGWARAAWMLALPVAGMALLWSLPPGSAGELNLLGLTLEPMRVDALSRIFATAFLIAALLGTVYGLHLRDAVQQCAILVYAGAAVGGALAGDLISLFVYWEIAGLSSVFLIWAGRTERAYRAGMRYLIAQVLSGLLLLGGVVYRVAEGKGIVFGALALEGPGEWMILLAIGMKCAFPVLHAWIQDTYPEATVVGTVVLSSFTTKLAIYALARGYAGTDLLIWIGTAMACFPIFYAVIENDLRRVLAYSMINQLGFMVVGIGVGGALGVNGAAAHAFADILFKGLLFMSIGAVLLRTGTANGSDLGGLYKSMPQTTILCIVGAASISAFPLFSGFVTKSLIMEAVAREHLTWVWLALLFAAAGVFHHAGIKIPYFAFFAHDRGYRVQEAPLNMRIAMALAAIGCVAIGCMPDVLYGLLPYPMEYVPYTTAHVINQVQLLLLSAMAFTVLMRTGIYPPELRSVNLDFDWFYRRALPATVGCASTALQRVTGILQSPLQALGLWWVTRGVAPLRETGWWVRTWSTAVMVWWAVFLFGAYLLVSLIF